ncbi:MAG: aminoacyl-tRNA hydrolase, partial [Candidatus Moraniibacteriota bacterium]
LILGLGNPGKEYEATRHNAGFLFLDFLQETLGFEPFVLDKKMSAEISSGMDHGEKILLVKPTTFMNNSGTTAQALIQFYKLSPANISVIHDDLDIEKGAYKTTFSSRHAGHNGVADIIEKLGTQEFFRVRLGIGRPLCIACSTNEPHIDGDICISTHDYVLQKFGEEELLKLQKLFPEIKEAVLNLK